MTPLSLHLNSTYKYFSMPESPTEPSLIVLSASFEHIPALVLLVHCAYITGQGALSPRGLGFFPLSNMFICYVYRITSTISASLFAAPTITMTKLNWKNYLVCSPCSRIHNILEILFQMKKNPNGINWTPSYVLFYDSRLNKMS